MRFPLWASPQHPIVRRETELWRRTFRRWRWVIVPFALLPCACTAIFTLAAAPMAAEASSPAWMIAILAGWVILTGLWFAGGLLTWALGTFANIGAAVMVARERETHNWAMLRLTTIPIREVIVAKIAALMRLLFWPTAASVGLTLVSSILTVLAMIAGVTALANAAPQDIPREAQVAIIAILLGGTPVVSLYAVALTIISLLYNCAVGLLTSTLTRTTGSAVVMSFGVHFAINLFIFVPVQQVATIIVQFLGGALAFATQSPLAFVLFVPLVSFVLPVVLELAIGAAAFIVALNRAQAIVE